MELIKIARFILFIFWVASGAYILYATKSHPALVVGITAAVALGPYIRPWPLGATITWIGLCGMGLLFSGYGGFLELGLFGAPAVLLLSSTIAFLWGKLRKT